MKYCSHCGAQLDDAAVFCPKCGCPTELYNNSMQYNPQNYAENNHNGKGNSISALAIIGFVFAFINAIVGLVCSIVAYKIAVTEGNVKSKSFAKTGVILSAVLLVLRIIAFICLIVILINTEPSYPPYDPYDYIF